MKKIQFRAWDKSEEMMCFVSIIDFEHKEVTLLYPTETYKEDDKSFDEIELMQYTGLKDKNGKEIYEGDIVRWVDIDGKIYTSKVFFKNGAFLPVCNIFRQSIDCEIIGNIYEDEDLFRVINNE